LRSGGVGHERRAASPKQGRNGGRAGKEKPKEKKRPRARTPDFRKEQFKKRQKREAGAQPHKKDGEKKTTASGEMTKRGEHGGEDT